MDGLGSVPTCAEDGPVDAPGTLAQDKNIPFLLPILAELAAAGHGTKLVLVGKHDPDARIQVTRLARQHGVEDRIKFAGFVDDCVLADLMRRCSCFVFPSRDEGFGLAVIEAMACGAPVVASAAGSLPEVVADGGILLALDDRAAWVRTLRLILDDPQFVMISGGEGSGEPSVLRGRKSPAAIFASSSAMRGPESAWTCRVRLSPRLPLARRQRHYKGTRYDHKRTMR
jgi:glycosyltransferase involved in cell wall biosynthesis